MYSVVNHYKCTLALSEQPNILRLHYADMTRDLAGSMARISSHLEIRHPPETMATLVEAATFDSMKSNADRFAPASGYDVWHQVDAFFDSGTSNKWEGRLTDTELAEYDERISKELSPAERAWLEWGGSATQVH